jgi:hypothetical protein
MKSVKVLIALALFLLSFQAEGAAGKEKFDLEKREADRVTTRNLQVWNRDQKYRQDSFAYGPFHLHGPINVFDLAFDNMKICRTHIWGKSNHSHASPGSDLNETNTGIGYACRINENDTHRWWWAADTIRNSHRLPANFTGPIYQYPLFEVGGLKFLVGGQMAFMNYYNPVREGGDPSGRIVGQRSANLIMGVPGWTVEGTGRFKYLAFDWGRIPLADVTIMRFSLQARFLW